MQAFVVAERLLRWGVAVTADPQIANGAKASPADDAGRALIALLDLERPELAAVRRAADIGDAAAAAAAALDHFAHKRLPAELDEVGAVDGDHAPLDLATAEAILDDIFTFQGATGGAPRGPNGLDWAHQGPNDDPEWAWFLNRHLVFRSLLSAWRDTGDVRFAAGFDRLLADWLEQNPVPSGDTMSPAWRVMEAGSRLLQSWPQAFYGFRASSAFQPATRLRLLLSVVDHARQLQRFHRRRHNHTIKEMAGLAVAGLVWPEFRDADGWYDYAMGTLDEDLAWQLYPDGTHTELTSGYHITVLVYALSVVRLARALARPLPVGLDTKLDAMVDYLAQTIHPSGAAPLNNDSDVKDVRPLLHRCAVAAGRPDWLFLATDGADGEVPRRPASRLLPWAGQLVMRDGFGPDSSWAFFDLGPAGTAPSHNHDDKLHLSLAVAGRDVLVDTGRATYRSGPLRDHVKSAAAHNVLIVDDVVRRDDPLRWETPLADGCATITRALDVALGWRTAGFVDLEGELAQGRLVIHRRGGWWLVADLMVTDRPRRSRTFWHFHPDLEVVQDGRDLVTRGPRPGHLRLMPVLGADWTTACVAGATEPQIQGWWSCRYNEVLPAVTAVMSAKVDGLQPVLWLLLPGRDTAPARPSVAITDAASGGAALNIHSPDGGVERVAFHAGFGRPVRLAEDTVERAVIWQGRAAAEVARVSLVPPPA